VSVGIPGGGIIFKRTSTKWVKARQITAEGTKKERMQVEFIIDKMAPTTLK